MIIFDQGKDIRRKAEEVPSQRNMGRKFVVKIPQKEETCCRGTICDSSSQTGGDTRF